MVKKNFNLIGRDFFLVSLIVGGSLFSMGNAHHQKYMIALDILSSFDSSHLFTQNCNLTV